MACCHTNPNPTSSTDSEIISCECSKEPIDLHISAINPTDVSHRPWVYTYSPRENNDIDKVLGKWLIFRSFSEIDETWHVIRKEIECGVLTEVTHSAKCSALYYNPSCAGPGPRPDGAICVYTSEEDVDRAGFVLINILKHDIKYKTDHATLSGRYHWKGADPYFKTLYWNGGEPSFKSTGMQHPGPCYIGIEDKWHLNRVSAPDVVMSTEVIYGRWIITPEIDDLTDLWHFLKMKIESGKLGPVEMICPPKTNRQDPNEDPVFLLHTGSSNKESVGEAISAAAKNTLVYEVGDRADHSSTCSD